MSVTPTTTLNRAAGDQLCDGGLKVKGQLETTAAGTIGGNLVVNGGSTLNGDVNIGGGGVLYGGVRAETQPDSNADISRNCISVCVPAGSSPYTWTIFGVGQADGNWVEVYCNSTGTCTLKDPSGNTLALLNGGGVNPVHAKAVRISGTWYICNLSKG